MKTSLVLYALCAICAAGCVIKSAQSARSSLAPMTEAYEFSPVLNVNRTATGLIVFWSNPDPNTNTTWLPEFSTDGINWARWGAQGSYIPDRAARLANARCLNCLYFIDTDIGLDTNWYVRLRKGVRY